MIGGNDITPLVGLDLTGGTAPSTLASATVRASQYCIGSGNGSCITSWPSGSSQWANTSSGMTGIYYNWAVGVGRSNASYILDVLGSARISGSLGVGGADPSSSYSINSGGSINAPYLCINGNCKSSWSSGWITSSSGDLYSGSADSGGANVYVGIGTSTPLYPLHVLTYKNTGSSWVNDISEYYYGSLGSQITSNSAPSPRNIGILANYSIMTGSSFIVSSDARIKKVLGISDSKSDLETIRNIQVTDYEYIDKFERGDRKQKKLIAQQVEEFYPQAVGLSTGIVPDILKPVESFSINGREVNVDLKSHNIKVGDKVRIIFEKIDPKNRSKKLAAVEDIFGITKSSKNSFSIETSKGMSAVNPKEWVAFVYGHQVDDFRTIDYEAIAMLNVSATQELAKQSVTHDDRLSVIEQKLEIIPQNIGAKNKFIDWSKPITMKYFVIFGAIFAFLNVVVLAMFFMHFNRKLNKK